MPKIVITHGVADGGTWLGFNAERAVLCRQVEDERQCFAHLPQYHRSDVASDMADADGRDGANVLTLRRRGSVQAVRWVGFDRHL